MIDVGTRTVSKQVIDRAFEYAKIAYEEGESVQITMSADKINVATRVGTSKDFKDEHSYIILIKNYHSNNFYPLLEHYGDLAKAASALLKEAARHTSLYISRGLNCTCFFDKENNRCTISVEGCKYVEITVEDKKDGYKNKV